MSITIQPKAKKQWKKPPVMVVTSRKLHEVKIYAEDGFWDAWKKHRFDLNLVSVFYKEAPQLSEDEVITITDGKSVITGYRLGLNSAVLTGGYMMNSVYNKEWAGKKGFVFAPHRQVRLGLDHRDHFIKRYKKRGFDLGLVCEFIIRAPMGKLGQRIKIVGENDTLIGSRTTEYGSVLITGMKRDCIDMDEYVDWKL